MTILKSQYPAILVLEYGIDHTGEMDVQCDIVEPDIALFTTLSPSHLVGFGDENGYFQEKEKLIRRKTKKTYAIGNRDDTHQSNFSCDSWYGESLQSTLTMADITS